MTRMILVVFLSIGACALATRDAGATIGDVDQTFGGDGDVNTTFPNRVSLRRLLVQPDGRILAVGHRIGTAAFSPRGHVMARYFADGSLDPSFGSGGTVQILTPGGQADASVTSAVIQSDGSIVVAGLTPAGPMVVRYSDSGVPDATFGSGGVTFIAFGDDAVLVQQADAGLLLAVEQGGSIRLARLLSNGTPDPGFGVGGLGPAVAIASGDVSIDDMALQPDGRPVVGGTTGVSTYVIRFLTTGAPDTGFGVGGIATTAVTPLGCTVSPGSAVAIDAGGGVLFADTVICGGEGTVVPEGNSVVLPAVVRLTGAGVLDTTFGVNGAAGPSLVPETTGGTAVFPALDGSVLVGGFRLELIGVTPEGAFDPRLGVGGSTGQGSTGSGSAAVRQADGNIVLGITAGQGDVFRLVRREGACTGPDSDGDGRSDGCDPCTGGTVADHLLVKAAKLRLPYGNDTLSVTAKATFAVPPVIDPTVTEVRVLLEDADGGIVLDAPTLRGLPAGWTARITPKASTYRYSNKIVTPGQASTVKVVLAASGKVTASLKMRSAVFRTDATRLPARASFILAPPNAVGGECITADLASPVACAFSGTGDSLKCKR